MKNTRIPRYAETAAKPAPRFSVLSLLTNTVLLGGGYFICQIAFA